MDKYEVLPPDTDWRQMFRLGDVKPSPRDPRDFPVLARGEAPAALPAEFRLHERPIRNQGMKGSCAAFAMTRILERAHVLAGRPFDGSEEAGYAWTRQFRQWLCTDSGSLPRDYGEMFVKHGLMTEAQRPYNDRDLCTGVTDADLALGAPQKAAEYRLARDWQEAKQAIYTLQTGVCVCFTLSNSFYEAARGGVVPLPSGGYVGGHAMTCEGWRTIGTKEYAIVANSWSPGFGDGGYVYIPIEMMDGRAGDGSVWTGDLWTVVVQAPQPQPEPGPQPQPGPQPTPDPAGYDRGFADARARAVEIAAGAARYYEQTAAALAEGELRRLMAFGGRVAGFLRDEDSAMQPARPGASGYPMPDA